MDVVDVDLLLELNQSIPRYTSYPTAPMWKDFSSHEYERALESVIEPFSLYIHIPFCESMCLYCGCSVVLNRRPENEERYVKYLIREIELIADKIKSKKVEQLHFGGGTPTKLSIEQFERIFATLKEKFDFTNCSEIAIEIDPRTVEDGKKLEALSRLGFNRVSFGVQDTNQKVQQAVRRYQTYEMTKNTFQKARELGFEGINIDLIYGLPLQTEITFSRTIEEIIELDPDRIALFSYAKVPWLKPHQKAIKDEDLPTTEEKFRIYAYARNRLCQAGFMAIGMDHFAKKEDSLARAFYEKELGRNFQGYTVQKTSQMIGLGITAIGHVSNNYVQNVKDLASYYKAIEERRLPCERGKKLAQNDFIERACIHRIMCDFVLDKQKFSQEFAISFDDYFKQALLRLDPLIEKGLVKNEKEKLIVTSKGELFVRNIAACFDAYLHEGAKTNQFSQSI